MNTYSGGGMLVDTGYCLPSFGFISHNTAMNNKHVHTIIFKDKNRMAPSPNDPIPVAGTQLCMQMPRMENCCLILLLLQQTM